MITMKVKPWTTKAFFLDKALNRKLIRKIKWKRKRRKVKSYQNALMERNVTGKTDFIFACSKLNLNTEIFVSSIHSHFSVWAFVNSHLDSVVDTYVRNPLGRKARVVGVYSDKRGCSDNLHLVFCSLVKKLRKGKQISFFNLG